MTTMTTQARQLWFGLGLTPKHRDWLQRMVNLLKTGDGVVWDEGDSSLDVMAASADADDRPVLVVFTETWDDQLTAADTTYLREELSKQVVSSVFQSSDLIPSHCDPLSSLALNVMSSPTDEPREDQKNFRLVWANLQFYTNYDPRLGSSAPSRKLRFSPQQQFLEPVKHDACC